MLSEILKCDVDWSKVRCFHLDEYCGIDINHKASFVKYLKERFADLVQPSLMEFNYIYG